MNKHKLIMESWRRFLKENQQNKVYLYEKVSGRLHGIVLYVVGDTSSVQDIFFTSKEIGAVNIIQTQNACIPLTYEVASIHTNDDFKRQGYGTILYDFAMFLAQSLGGGLTSDRRSGTKTTASMIWDKIGKNTTKYGKRKTPEVPIAHDSEDAPEDAVPAFLLRPQPEPGATTVGGNDKFDYHFQTPDPEDDCSQSPYGGNATDHSFYLKDTTEISTKFSEFKSNHDNLIKFISSNEEEDFTANTFLQTLQQRSLDNFMDQYTDKD